MKFKVGDVVVMTEKSWGLDFGLIETKERYLGLKEIWAEKICNHLCEVIRIIPEGERRGGKEFVVKQLDYRRQKGLVEEIEEAVWRVGRKSIRPATEEEEVMYCMMKLSGGR